MGSQSAPASLRVAVTQHEPVWLDLQGTVDKTCKIIAEAASEGAKLVAFPECWIPGYPAWIWSRPVDFELGVKYVENSIAIGLPEFKQIQDAAAENGISVALGFSERSGNSVYIAQALIGDTGDILMKRRKMKPTHMERTIFGDASGDCLAQVVKLPMGVSVGGLSCWEHIQPLLKYYTFSQGEQVHVAAWPPLDPCPDESPGLYSMSADGCRTLSQTYAMEAQSFVLHCVTVLTEKGYDTMGTKGAPIMGSPSIGNSCVIGPDGRLLTPKEHQNEELLVVDLDLALVIKNKTFADASGHCKSDLMNLMVDADYMPDSRPDLLWLGADPFLKPVVRPNAV
jgi:nitrilase